MRFVFDILLVSLCGIGWYGMLIFAQNNNRLKDRLQALSIRFRRDQDMIILTEHAVRTVAEALTSSTAGIGLFHGVGAGIEAVRRSHHAPGLDRRLARSGSIVPA